MKYRCVNEFLIIFHNSFVPDKLIVFGFCLVMISSAGYIESGECQRLNLTLLLYLYIGLLLCLGVVQG